MGKLDRQLIRFLRRKPRLGKGVYIARGAIVLGDVKLGDFSSVWYNAVLRGDINRIVVGHHTNIQDNAVLHLADDFPCLVGSYVTVGHSAVVHACTVGDEVLVGMGAIILDGAVIGKQSIVGAGALEKDRDRRFATAGEFATAMSAAVGRPNDQPPAAGATVQLRPTPAPAPTTPLKDVSALASAATSALIVEAVAPPPSRPSPSSLPTPPRRRRVAIGGAILAIVVVAVVVVVVAGTRGGTSPASVAPPVPSPPVAVDAVAAAPPQAPSADDPVADLIARAGGLAAGGRLKPAIDLLAKARKTYPQDARLPYHAGMLYLDKMYFADGLPLVRAAIELDPAYRRDDALIKLLVRGFNATASYDGTIARFLRDDIGEAAKPYLEQTAKSHPNPIVRNRATAELRRY